MGLLENMDDPTTLGALARTMFESQTGMDKLRVSYANAMWASARIEAELFVVYITACNGIGGNFKAMQEAYWRVITAKSRFDMTHAAARTVWFHTSVWDQWLPLSERARTEIGARGKIAHLEGMVAFPDKNKQDKPIALLLQNTWHPDHTFNYNQRKNRGFTAAQLDEMEARWSRLAFDISAFANPLFTQSLARQEKLLLASAPQDVGPDQGSAAPKRRSPTKRGKPPQPPQE